MNASAAGEYVAAILHGVTMAHMHHLTTDSYSKHQALGELYEGLAGAADRLAESAMGCYGIRLQFGGVEFRVTADPIRDVQRLYEFVERERKAMGEESHIQNEVDEVCTLLASTLYKLRRLS